MNNNPRTDDYLQIEDFLSNRATLATATLFLHFIQGRGWPASEVLPTVHEEIRCFNRIDFGEKNLVVALTEATYKRLNPGCLPSNQSIMHRRFSDPSSLKSNIDAQQIQVILFSTGNHHSTEFRLSDDNSNSSQEAGVLRTSSLSPRKKLQK